MGITVTPGAVGYGSGGQAPGTFPTTLGGHIYAVVASTVTSSISTPTDTAGNTYSTLASYDGLYGSLRIFYAPYYATTNGGTINVGASNMSYFFLHVFGTCPPAINSAAKTQDFNSSGSASIGVNSPGSEGLALYSLIGGSWTSGDADTTNGAWSSDYSNATEGLLCQYKISDQVGTSYSWNFTGSGGSSSVLGVKLRPDSRPARRYSSRTFHAVTRAGHY